MQDGAFVDKLVSAGSDAHRLAAAQKIAAKRLLALDGEVYPHDGCAITLSVLMQAAGSDLPDVFRAFDLVAALKRRGWTAVPPGAQRAGDVGTTCGPAPHHGTDHVYLLLRKVGADEMIIADNQAPYPHFRYASAHGGKSPTTGFLRAG
jgi:hypothetical protein